MSDLAWHFVRRGKNGGPMLRDGRPLIVGEWLQETDVRICEYGLHASRTPLDALSFVSWDDGFVCLVECEEIAAEEHSDKLVCGRRRAVFALPCDELLRDFARHAALTVLPLCPDAQAIVREYLETGREEISAAARAAARAAADAAAWADDAAALAAADAAAWAAARAAAWAAAAAARAAARAAAWAADDAAAWAALNGDLESMILSRAIEEGWSP